MASPRASLDIELERAVQEVMVFKGLTTSAMYTKNNPSYEIYRDPLKWWAIEAHELHKLTQRMLAISVSQAKSERLFPSVGAITMKKRNSLDADTVELLVMPKNPWTAVESLKKSRASIRLIGEFLRCSFVHLLSISPMYRSRSLDSPIICF